MNNEDPRRYKYLKIEAVIGYLQHIVEENPHKDIRVCVLQDRMNGYIDRSKFDIAFEIKDNVVEFIGRR